MSFHLKLFIMKTNFSFVITARLGLILLIFTALIACNKTLPVNEDLGPYNINVALRSVDSKGFGKGYGMVKFRQDPDPAQIITLDTWVFNLKPNHDYILQRAANPITDPDCINAGWLHLGKGTVAQAIHTDGIGNGMENLFRDVSAIAKGSEFHIHFEIIDAVTSDTVLVSDCEQYTVR
jgi:hypothetical protein